MTTFTQSQGARVADREYFDLTLAMIESAKRRIWASLFIYDIRPGRDVEGLVLDLTAALIQRRRSGVDVRVLMNGRVRTQDISVANLATGLYLDGARVPTRRVFATDAQRSGSHAKFVIYDDTAILGSQNWTDDAFTANIEDAVLLTGDAIVGLESQFASLWNDGKGLPANVAR